MGCFFEDQPGKFCSVRTTPRIHPFELNWILICSKHIDEWDRFIWEEIIPHEDEEEDDGLGSD